MNRFIQVVALILAAAVAAGCSSTKKGAAGIDDQSGAGAGAQGAGGAGAWTGNPLDDPSSPLSKRIVYFDYDSAEVTAEGRDIVAAHAQYLAANPGVTITLEGHADERGSREYNIGLGENRANAVRNLMTVQGASSNQIRTVSYGEEKPAVQGNDDYAWSQNRRVEIVYPAYQ
jgi:peptidoglycan-associated lipoprotein